MKRCLAVVLAMLTIAIPLSVNAETNNIKVDGSVDINSTSSPDNPDNPNNPILVTVPTALYFTITPDQERLVTTIPDTITNHGNRPVQVGVIGYEASNNNKCKVIEPDTYTDSEWINLGKADTESKIGLGLKNTDTNNVYWSPEGVTSKTTDKIDTFNISADNEANIEVEVKCGTAWSSDRVLDYNLYLMLS